jgi:site-specific DNA-methyltransferase (adenine-specific)
MNLNYEKENRENRENKEKNENKKLNNKEEKENENIKNLLYYGDNLEIMRKYIPNNSINLCYIDPPFNSKRNYNQIYINQGKEDMAQSEAFSDTWSWNESAQKSFEEILVNENSVYTTQTIKLIEGLEGVLKKDSMLAYIVYMAQRIQEIWRVLKPEGSFYLHCDPTMSHYLKLLLDSVFVARGGKFLNEVIWCYGSGGVSKNHFSRKHDDIFFYSKSKNYKFNVDNVREPYNSDEKGKYKVSRSGKLYLRQHELGRIPFDWWQISTLNNFTKERLGYPTQKPEALLERIIKASSNEGDTVLDAFCGCGTTVSVAQRLNRRWVGIDITYQAIALIEKRLQDTFGIEALKNLKLKGIPKDLESARKLANNPNDRTRKEFEKWAILSYTGNRATINEKKGADGGIDGRTLIFDFENKKKEILFSVKSGHVGLSQIRDFIHVVEREKASMGVFLTLEPPTEPMKREALSAGMFESDPKIRIVTAEEIIKGAHLNAKGIIPVYKSSERQGTENNVGNEQMRIAI